MSAVTIKAVDRVLTYLSLSEAMLPYAAAEEWPDEQIDWLRLGLSYFNGADPAYAYPDELGSANFLRSHERLFVASEDGSQRRLGVKFSDLAGSPLDESYLIKASDPADENRRVLYQVQRIRRVPLSEVRGMFPLRTGKVIEYSFARIFGDGKYEPCRYYAEEFNGTWQVIGQPYYLEKIEPAPEADQGNISVGIAAAFTNFYEWRVCLGYRGLPTIGLITDPEGARDVFRLRDLPNGASRRAALRHWVEGHYRRKVVPDQDYDAEAIKVIAHLRGATEFVWNGLQCSIRPSHYDLRRAEKERARGEAAKARAKAAGKGKKKHAQKKDEAYRSAGQGRTEAQRQQQ
jgi:hypothetical protein